MRIGIDMLGCQSPASRGRGIGRYGRSLVSAMLAAAKDDEFVLLAHDDLPVDMIPAAPNATIRVLDRCESTGEAIDRVVRSDREAFDAILILSPFEVGVGYDPPHRPIDGPALASVVYDLIPFRFQEKYLTWPPVAASLYRNLERLRRYDALLAISGATRSDTLGLIGLGEDRVVNISGASDPTFFTPDRSGPIPDALLRLGIDAPFVFCLGSDDERKNLAGLFDAFRLLPDPIRSAHRLVIACALPEKETARLRKLAADHGFAGSLVLAGEIDDGLLRTLYQRCSAFAFPSKYEGFGLPILEAMHCGAPVVAGNNSSQVEVLGDAGLLANALDPVDISAKLARILTDPALAEDLGRRGLERARIFSWEASAGRALGAIAGAVEARSRRLRLRADRRHRPEKPRIAVFSPWPPKKSGISDYALRLVRSLRRHYEIDLYHDSGYEPEIGADASEFGVFDHRLFERHDRGRAYRGVLYQMGNSHYHRFIYDAMARRPGVVTLHDLCLSGFHDWYARQPFADPDHLPARIASFRPGLAIDPATLAAWDREDGGIPAACARRGLFLFREVFARALRVVVHSPWCLGQARDSTPELAGKAALIPMGATPRDVAWADRMATRDRFGLPRSALIFGGFGHLHPTKLNVETIAAFETVARRYEDAILILAGQDLGFGEAASAVSALGLDGRVRILGRQADADFADLIAAVDVGISLRRPPTGGETSAALLDLLRHGVPTVVADVGTFSDYPDTVVRKVRWDADGPESLTRALLDLATDRRNLGLAAMEHVRRGHDWDRAADAYAAVIDEAGGSGIGRGPSSVGSRNPRTVLH